MDVTEGYAYWILAAITDEDVRPEVATFGKKLSADQVAVAKIRAKKLQEEFEAKLKAQNTSK